MTSKSSSSSYGVNKHQSYGIMCFRIPPEGKTIEYLMVRRKHSIGFLQIVFGKYKPRDIRLLRKLVADTTARERKLLVSASFQILVQDVFPGMTPPQDPVKMEKAKKKFHEIKVGYRANALKQKGCYVPSFHFQSAKTFDSDTEYVPSWKRDEPSWTQTAPSRSRYEWISWYSLCQKARLYTPPLAWGFPKGLGMPGETALDTAQRELQEETNLTKRDYTILSKYIPLWEIFQGLNDSSYKYTYFVAQANGYRPVQLDPTNDIQQREISDIQWLEYNIALEQMRPADNLKRHILTRLHQELCKNYKIEFSPNKK